MGKAWPPLSRCPKCTNVSAKVLCMGFSGIPGCRKQRDKLKFYEWTSSNDPVIWSVQFSKHRKSRIVQLPVLKDKFSCFSLPIFQQALLQQGSDEICAYQSYLTCITTYSKSCESFTQFSSPKCIKILNIFAGFFQCTKAEVPCLGTISKGHSLGLLLLLVLIFLILNSLVNTFQQQSKMNDES